VWWRFARRPRRCRLRCDDATPPTPTDSRGAHRWGESAVGGRSVGGRWAVGGRSVGGRWAASLQRGPGYALAATGRRRGGDGAATGPRRGGDGAQFVEADHRAAVWRLCIELDESWTRAGRELDESWTMAPFFSAKSGSVLSSQVRGFRHVMCSDVLGVEHAPDLAAPDLAAPDLAAPDLAAPDLAALDREAIRGQFVPQPIQRPMARGGDLALRRRRGPAARLGDHPTALAFDARLRCSPSMLAFDARLRCSPSM